MLHPAEARQPGRNDFACPEEVNRILSRTTLLALVTVLTLVAGWLRFTATSFGLPDKFRPDEEYIIYPALGFESDWNPHFAGYPAAQMYVVHAGLKYYAALIGKRENFRAAYADNGQALAYLVGRRVSAAMGTFTVPLIYLAGAPAFGPEAALAASAIITFSTIHLRESKYAVTDVATAFWLTIALAMLLRIIRSGRDEDYIGAGFFSGLATATKYPAGAIFFGLAAAHLEARHREGRSLWSSLGDLRPYMAAWTAMIAFFCATPYVILDRAQTIADFAFHRGRILYGVGNQQAGFGWSWLLLRAMPDSFGYALQLVLLISLLWGLLRHKPGTLTLLTFIIIAFFGMTNSHYVFYRYLMIPFPAMALMAGVLIGDLITYATRRLGRRPALALATLAIGFLLAPSLRRDLQLNWLLSQTDTRTLARQWIEAHIPPNSAIAASDSTTPYGKPQLPSQYRLVPFADPTALKAQDIHWIVSDSFAPLAYYSRGPTTSELAALNSQATLVFDVDPTKPGAPAPVVDAADAFYAPLGHISSMTRPGPRIRIWEIK